MIFRGPGFLAVVFLGSSLLPPPSPISNVDRRHIGRLRKGDYLLTGERGLGGRGEGGAKLYESQESLALYKSFNTLWFILMKDTGFERLKFLFDNNMFLRK
jgi:hypothetical protein